MTGATDRLAIVALGDAEGVATARRVTRDAAAALGLPEQDQTRVATAVSELARNAYLHAVGGRLVLDVDLGSGDLICTVQDDGPGIEDLSAALTGRRVRGGVGQGLVGVQRLVDDLALRSGPDGTLASFRRARPADHRLDVASLRQRLRRRVARDAQEELEHQNQELLRALAELRAREQELLALNRELDDTNRGMVALHHELDAQAERDRRISRVLQHSLMPERLTGIPGLQVEGSHRSAGEGSLIGGDFYDVVQVGARRCWLVMGDVAGHGVETAAKANELRQSVRVYAREGHGLAEAMRRLNALVLADDLVGMATLSVVAVDLSAASATAEVLLAGHPPPLLTAPGRPPTLFEEPRGTVLGVPGATWRTGLHELPGDARLVLYSDGLVERVGESLDVGLERLRALGAKLATAAHPVDDVHRLVPDDQPLRDDVAVLVATLTDAEDRDAP